MVLTIPSCSCKNKAGIKITDTLKYHTSSRKINYCKMLNKAISEDPSELKSFLKIEIYDGAGYDHGSVLVDLIDYLGEYRFLELSDGLSDKSKANVIEYLEVGLEYNSEEKRDLYSRFPVIYWRWK